VIEVFPRSRGRGRGRGGRIGRWRSLRVVPIDHIGIVGLVSIIRNETGLRILRVDIGIIIVVWIEVELITSSVVMVMVTRTTGVRSTVGVVIVEITHRDR
jgi:hypothetical protein